MKRCPWAMVQHALAVNRDARNMLAPQFWQFGYQKHWIERCLSKYTIHLQKDLVCVGNVGPWTATGFSREFFTKVQYVYMPIGGLRVELDQSWMSGLADEHNFRLPCFKDLKHLFIILAGLPPHQNNGRIPQEVKNLLQEIANRNAGWKLPPWTIVEDEIKLLELWQGWRESIETSTFLKT
ncbi:hypothetical protein BDZ45DRAFT_752710 [Acephala macrosclerotiorum]|nr:hypothetical protein BDZ45DRAFT_752710 [Acephala macrosclerotiorum]